MSRRASNSVKLARKDARKIGTRLDRNGIPVLDDGRKNFLPKRCGPGQHEYVVTDRKFAGHGFDGMIEKYTVELRCVLCRDRIVETRSVVLEA